MAINFYPHNYSKLIDIRLIQNNYIEFSFYTHNHIISKKIIGPIISNYKCNSDFIHHLQELKKLQNDGVLTHEEFELSKKKMLSNFISSHSHSHSHSDKE